MNNVIPFGVSRFADMAEEVKGLFGGKEVDRRCAHLPLEFKRELIEELRRRSRERAENR